MLGCTNSDAEVSEVLAEETRPVQTITNGTFRYSERGVILHELHAGEMRREERGNAEVSEDMVEVRNGFELFIGGNATKQQALMTADLEDHSVEPQRLSLIHISEPTET